MILLELLIVLGAIVLGMRMGGIGLGVMGCLALLLLVALFGVVPGEPPFSVLLIMMAALTAAAALEAAGSLDLLIYWAHQLFIRYPRYLVWLSALVTYLFVFFVGTSHIVYVLFPVIAQAARRGGIRPERPLVASMIASQQAILASPVSAATAIMSHSMNFSRSFLLSILGPASLVGTLVATWVAGRLGENPRFCPFNSQKTSAKAYQAPPFARKALGIFFVGLLCVVWSDKVLPEKSMKSFSALVLFAIAGVITCFIGTKEITKGRIFPIGMQGVIAILGVAWLSNSFLTHHAKALQPWAAAHLSSGWHWMLLFFLVTILSTSQGATLKMALPLGVATLGAPAMCYVIPAVNSIYVLPSYPTMLAAIAFDSTGSTRVGRFVLNHSFILPGLAGTAVTCWSAYVICSFC